MTRQRSVTRRSDPELHALFALALALLLTTGCVSEKRVDYKLEHRFNVEDPTFHRSLDSLGNTMLTGNTAVILQNGDEIFPAMIGAIRAAKKSVNLETYIYLDDEAGRLFADALIDAAKRGVAVRVLVDAVGSKMGTLTDEFKKAGVDLRVFRPVSPLALHKIGKRTHRKILVVDGRVCFTGGMCIDKRWLGNARNESEWRDTQAHITGPVAGQMQSIFAENWTYTTGEILVGEDFYPAIDPEGSLQAQAIKVSLGDSTSLSKMLYYLAIQSAEKSIHLQNAYFLPDHQIRDALVKAVERGVDVEVMVPGSQIDIPLVRQASRKYYGELLRGGVKIFEYQATMMHNKTMVVDGMFSVVGSINLDARSMGKNAEDSLVFYDRDFSERLEKMFQEDLTKCRPITLEAWSDRGFRARMAEHFSRLFKPYF
jgi:cardiolipin synthase